MIYRELVTSNSQIRHFDNLCLKENQATVNQRMMSVDYYIAVPSMLYKEWQNVLKPNECSAIYALKYSFLNVDLNH